MKAFHLFQLWRTLVTENIFLKRQNFKPPAATKSHIVNRDDVVWLRSWGLVGWTLGEEIQSSKYDHRIFGQLTSIWSTAQQQKEATGLSIKTTLACLSQLESSLRCSWWHTGQKSFLTHMEGHTSAGGCTSNRQPESHPFLLLFARTSLVKKKKSLSTTAFAPLH